MSDSGFEGKQTLPERPTRATDVSVGRVNPATMQLKDTKQLEPSHALAGILNRHKLHTRKEVPYLLIRSSTKGFPVILEVWANASTTWPGLTLGRNGPFRIIRKLRNNRVTTQARDLATCKGRFRMPKTHSLMCFEHGQNEIVDLSHDDSIDVKLKRVRSSELENILAI